MFGWNLKELPLDDTIDCTTKPSEYSLRVWNLFKPPLKKKEFLWV